MFNLIGPMKAYEEHSVLFAQQPAILIIVSNFEGNERKPLVQISFSDRFI